MPFISKDWRSPGEVWVKTDQGWERLKVLECGKRKRLPSTSEDDEADNDIDQPHCHITIRCTREIAGFNGLGDAVRRLDFRRSVRDRRRFHYICAFLRLLVTAKGIASLPGSAQRLLLQMIEEVAAQVSDSQQNINVMRGLAVQLQDIVNKENQKCWGKPLGSQDLWKNHVKTIQRIQSITSQIEITEPGPDIRPKLHDLPEDCIREIVLRIADHKDLESSSQAWTLMAAIVSEQRIWRELTRFHFTANQINFILNKRDFRRIRDVKDWQVIYHDLRKTYGLREDHEFGEVLALCRLCCCLFWPSAGHPCIVDESPDFRARLEEAAAGQLELSQAQPITPAEFLKYFSL